MCFSATASFVTGGALGSAGAVAMRASGGISRRPIAAVPFLFGAQQLVEGAVWISLGHPAAHASATLGFLLFSHVLWPSYLPYAVWKEETDRRRRDALAWCVWFGSAVSLYLL